MFDRDLNAHDIAKQYGTSTAMIDKFYIVYLSSDATSWKKILKIIIRKSKVKNLREVIGMTSAHDALTNLRKIYQMNDIECVGSIWRIQSFRTGLNDLLKSANLKTRQVGEYTVTRDSISFRKTYMCMMINRKVPHQRIAQNCGTSTAMIDKFYAVYLSSDSLIDIIVDSNSK